MSTAPSQPPVISYEYPLNERVRMLLRLENLFGRFMHHASLEAPTDHHAALLALFDVFEVVYRTELKSDLAQELERQRQALGVWRHNPAVSAQMLDRVLNQIDHASARLLELTGKSGQHLRDNDWLMNIKQRTTIPGGVCEFDLPSYQYWLNQDADTRQRDLAAWMGPLLSIREAIAIVLKLLRETGKTSRQVARKGLFQQMLAGKVAQMVRVELAREYNCVPEISANKHALNIRFIVFAPNQRSKVAEADIEFDLAFCNL
jgi:cell division protein ZapD